MKEDKKIYNDMKILTFTDLGEKTKIFVLKVEELETGYPKGAVIKKAFIPNPIYEGTTIDLICKIFIEEKCDRFLIQDSCYSNDEQFLESFKSKLYWNREMKRLGVKQPEMDISYD